MVFTVYCANVVDVKNYVLIDMPEEEVMLSNEEPMAKACIK